jgi:hypothetical protein
MEITHKERVNETSHLKRAALVDAKERQCSSIPRLARYIAKKDIDCQIHVVGMK